jgi:addiction module HigA family antidote
MSRKLKPLSPDEMIAEEFLKPLGMSNYRLAKEISVPAKRIGEILADARHHDGYRDLRLCGFFGLSGGRWLRLQADYDTEVGGPREDAREDQTVEGSSGADGGCGLMRCMRAAAS